VKFLSNGAAPARTYTSPTFQITSNSTKVLYFYDNGGNGELTENPIGPTPTPPPSPTPPPTPTPPPSIAPPIVEDLWDETRKEADGSRPRPDSLVESTIIMGEVGWNPSTIIPKDVLPNYNRVYTYGNIRLTNMRHNSDYRVAGYQQSDVRGAPWSTLVPDLSRLPDGRFRSMDGEVHNHTKGRDPIYYEDNNRPMGLQTTLSSTTSPNAEWRNQFWRITTRDFGMKHYRGRFVNGTSSSVTQGTWINHYIYLRPGIESMLYYEPGLYESSESTEYKALKYAKPGKIVIQGSAIREVVLVRPHWKYDHAYLYGTGVGGTVLNEFIMSRDVIAWYGANFRYQALAAPPVAHAGGNWFGYGENEFKIPQDWKPNADSYMKQGYKWESHALIPGYYRVMVSASDSNGDINKAKTFYGKSEKKWAHVFVPQGGTVTLTWTGSKLDGCE
jgi:hypothetical protein